MVDRYRLLSLIGEGPLTRVYLAEDAVTRKRFALRMLPDVIARDREETNRFRKSLIDVARFVHPCFVRLHHLHEVWEPGPNATATLGVREGSQILVTEAVAGEGLTAWTRQFPPRGVPREQAVALLGRLAQALDEAHEAGLVHGYLSPENILMTERGPVVTDLVVARELRRSLARVGSELSPVAAPRYAAPEQEDFATAGERSDQFALAALVFDLTHGGAPAAGARCERTASSAVRRALSDDPAERFDTCRAFVEALKAETALEEEPLLPAAAPLSAFLPGADSVPPVVPPPVSPPASLRASPDDTGPGIVVEPSDTAGAAAPDRGPPQNDKRPPPATDAGGGGRSAAGESGATGGMHPPRVAPPGERRKQGKRTRMARWLNVAIGVGITALLCLLLLVMRARKQEEPQPAEGAGRWQTLEKRTKLPRRFVQSLKLKNGLQAQQLIRARLFGQTRILDLEIGAGKARFLETTSRQGPLVLAEEALPGPIRTRSVIRVVKTPTTVAAYLDGVRTVGIPIPFEEWREFRWDTAGDAPPPYNASRQKIGGLVFADDFMHGDNELGVWEPVSDNWTVHALQNPIRSANPFSFVGRGKDALAVAGAWFWRNYRLECAVHPLAGSAFGVKFCRIDAENSYELIWGKEPDKGHSLLLLKVRDGERKILGRTETNVQTAQWLRLGVSQLEGLITVTFDGRKVIEAVDPNPLLGGQIGLWSRGGEGTVFDDVVVTPVSRLDLDLVGPMAYPPTVLRSFSPAASPGVQAKDLPTVLLQDVALTASVRGLGSGTTPFEMLARQHGSEALKFRLSRGPGPEWKAEILTFDGEFEQIHGASAPVDLPDAGRITFRVLGREAWVDMGGRILIHVTGLNHTKRGYCGVRAPAEAVIERLSVEPQEPLPPIENRVETFTYEESMQNWNSPVLEWAPEYGHRLGAYWHRSDFWNDVAVTMDVDTLLQIKENTPVGLMLKWPDNSTDEKGPTATLLVEPETKNLSLKVDGQEDRNYSLVAPVRTITLQQLQDRLLARLNGALLWNVPLPEEHGPLCRAGRLGRGSTDTWAEAVTIRAGGVETYVFKKAPTDWLPAAGTWKVTNRWQCDPRWSFFSGVQRSGVACNWNKITHGENVTVEFFAGPKMDQERGRRYEYAGDINAVICADGKDISSGYSFMFGGWNDRGSQITRQRRILKENRLSVVPRKSSTHRRWFCIKLRKYGNRLTFWIDGAQVATVADDKPLDGNRFGIWTWDNGIMVAQLRVSTTGALAVAETANDPITIPKTPYDE